MTGKELYYICGCCPSISSTWLLDVFHSSNLFREGEQRILDHLLHTISTSNLKRF